MPAQYLTIHTSTTEMASTAATHDAKLNMYAQQGWEPGQTSAFFAQNFYQMVTTLCYEPKEMKEGNGY